MTDHYDTLGVARDSTQAEIKAAYRRRSSAAHPDKGGSDADMAAVNRAYEVLSDPERRARFDAGGGDQKGQPVEEMAIELLVHMFTAAIEKAGEGKILRDVSDMLAGVVSAANDQRTDAQKKRKRLLARREKVATKPGVENLVHSIIDRQVAQLDRSIAQAEETLQVAKAARPMLDAYTTTEVAPPPSTFARQQDATMLNTLFGFR